MINPISTPFDHKLCQQLWTASASWILVACAMVSLLLTGCRQEPIEVFEPNLVQAMKYQVKDGLPMDQTTKDVTWALTRMFGTPNDPKLPESVTVDEELASIVSQENLIRASGPADADGRGRYRKHCALCHGITGNGRGTTAAVLTPYPRDYRMGIFKFKSTARGAKPTRDDIARLIRHGISGTAMVPIPALTESDIQALTDYVIYLSWRGELERRLIDDAALELDLEAGERVFNTEWVDSQEPDQKMAFEEQWQIANDYVAEIGEAWLDAEDDIYDVPEPPADLPVAQSREDYEKLMQSDQAESLAASVKRGQELFVGKIATCSKCHGDKGLGNGQTTDYDDWTKDWTTRVNLKPEDRDSLIPLLARGALPPLNALPRNFAQGIFHGGSASEDLYRRIAVGIEGTPMPAATFVEGQFDKDDVWDLINFIRSLQVNEDAAPVPAA